MNKQETYQHCLLTGGEEPSTRDRIGYWVTVDPEKAASEADRLFSELTFVTRTAITLKYNNDIANAFSDLEKLTFSKARARITLGLAARPHYLYQRRVSV